MTFAEYLQRNDRAKMPFVFIVTFGRSGSTLLQALLNRIPGYCIRGENDGALFHIYKALAGVERGQRVWSGGNTPSHPWFGAHLLQPDKTRRDFLEIFFTQVLNIDASTRCCGLKEIRYSTGHMTDTDFAGYMDFMEVNFPGAGFIFNVRSVAGAASSSQWAKSPQDPLRAMLEKTRRRLEKRAEGRANALVFDYDDWMADPDYAKGLFTFLGEPYDPAVVRSVLSVRQGF